MMERTIPYNMSLSSRRTTKERRKKQPGFYLFFIFNLLSIIAGYVYNIHAGAVACVVIVAYYFLNNKYFKVFSDKLFLSYLIINLLSVFWYFFNGRPIELFITCISYNLIPMLIYGFGYTIQNNERDNPVYKSLCINNVLIVGIGLIVYFIPSLAATLGKESIATAGISAEGIGYRFDSYLDSLTMGSLCAISIPIIMMVNFKRKLFRIVGVGLLFLGLFLTLQRGAWIIGGVGFLGSLILNVYFKKKHKLRLILFYVFIAVFAAFILYYFAYHFMSERFFTHLMIRISRLDFSAMMSDRNIQVENGFNTFFSYPLGFGLGSAGIKAANYGMQIVPDGNLLKVLVETGIFGFGVFSLLNIRGIIYGIRSKRYFSVIVLILFLVHCIGSNVLDFYYSSFVYWFVLGYLNNSKSKQNKAVNMV